MEYNDKFGLQADHFIYIYTKPIDFKQVVHEVGIIKKDYSNYLY